MRSALSILTVAAMVAPLAAQNAPTKALTVFPADHASAEGVTWDNNPVAAGISRMQFLYEQVDTQLPNGAQITRIGFRQDGAFALAGQQLQLEIQMGKANVSTATATTNFANNYDGAPTTVFSRKVFALPNFAKPTQEPSPNIVWITLDQPYVHDASKDLLLDVFVHANSNGNRSFTYPLDVARHYAPVDSVGLGCASSGGAVPAMTSTDPVLDTNWTLLLRTAPGSSNVMLIAGTLRAQPLPLDFIGMDNCNLYVNELGCLMAGATSTAGALNINLALPNRLTMYGQRMTFQAVIEDPFANAAGLVASNALDAQFGIPPRGAMLRTVGSTTSATGALTRNHGLVTLFDHQ